MFNHESLMKGFEAVFKLFIVLVAFQANSAGSPLFSYKTLTLDSPVTQGAMVIGHASNLKSLTVFERQVSIDSDGNFVFGIGRDAGPEMKIEVVWQNGNTEIISLPVIQRQYDIQRIDGVDDKFVRELSPELKERTRQEASLVWHARQNNSALEGFREVFIMPAEGPITGVYGSQRIFNGVPKRPHYGLDIAGPVGTLVKAPASGVVTLAYPDMYYSGGTLVLDHGQGISSTFIHLSKILVKEGAAIKKGEPIAEIGVTGRVTGPHLDWRINWFDQRLDPALVLPVNESAEK